MPNVSSAALRKRRRQLVRGLPQIAQILRGSLIETYKRCGRPNCHCIDGPGHGPKRYLSTVRQPGERPRLGYVPNATHAQVAEFLGPASVTATTVSRCRTAAEMNFIMAVQASIREVCRRKGRSRGTSTFPTCTLTASR